MERENIRCSIYLCFTDRDTLLRLTCIIFANFEFQFFRAFLEVVGRWFFHLAVLKLPHPTCSNEENTPNWRSSLLMAGDLSWHSGMTGCRLLHSLTGVWVLPTPKAGWNLLFHVFCTFLQDYDAKIMRNWHFLILFSNAGRHKNTDNFLFLTVFLTFFILKCDFTSS